MPFRHLWILLLATLAGACGAVPHQEPGPVYADRVWVGRHYRNAPSDYGEGHRRGTGVGGVELLAGLRSLSEGTFGNVRHQGVLGLRYLVPLGEGPLAVELGGSYSSDDNRVGDGTATLEGRLLEASLGLRLALGASHSDLVPYLGCGLTSIYARLEDQDLGLLRDDGTSGYYVNLGVRLYVDGNQYVALDWRAVEEADVRLFGGNEKADYHQLTLVVGASW